MGKFGIYNIDLKELAPGVHDFEFLLDNKFFADIDGTEVQKGKIKASVSVKSGAMMFELSFHLEGVAIVPCDRCLDDMEVPIDTHNRLVVKFGKEYSEEGDDIVIVPEEEGEINIAWFLYEFVALAIPMKHVHAPGKCNKTMAAKLRQHSSRRVDEEDDLDDEMSESDTQFEDDKNYTDPRWDALKGLIENDNN